MLSCRGRQYRTSNLLSVAALAVGAAVFAVRADAQVLPALPQTFLDTAYPPMAGQSTLVSAGGNLQSAINAAQRGDTILLEAGATFAGSFTLPVKSGTGWIIIRTSAPDSSLPPAGTRITPAYASVLPKIAASGVAPAIRTLAGAHGYRLTGVEIMMNTGVTTSNGLVQLGDTGTAQDSLAEVPYDLVLDRVYVHGTSTDALHRGVSFNCASCAVIDSHISDVHRVGFDTQAICGWNGPGPFKIVNNYLEASGENVMFGGGDPDILNLVQSDIEVRRNHFFKPLTWKIGHPTYAGTAWTVKNIFELKNARRVLVDGNIFEHNWLHAQNGFSILFTVRNQDGGAPWSVVEDVTFTNNIVRHVAAAVNILGTDDLQTSLQTKRILIKNNLFDDVNAATWGGSGRLFQMLDGAADVTIDHNTAFQSGEVIFAAGLPNDRFTYRNNLTPNNAFGVAGDNTTGNPLLTLSTYFPGATFARNVLVGGNPTKYPPDNFFPPTMSAVLFVDLAGGNYRLQPISLYKNAGTDGKDIGVDFNELEARPAGADFNADGKIDIVLRNYLTGQNAVWQMNGTALGAVVDLPALPNTNYRIEGTADFNANGQTDIVFRNYATGQDALWLMNGTTLGSIVDLPALPNTAFHFEGTGDFNGDGKPDIILRNYTTGQNALWVMNGTALSSIVDLPALSNTDFRIESAGDFNADGKPDIVLRNYVTGQNALWLMNGTAFSSIVDLPALPNTSYRIDGVGDLNTDGKPDIILRNYATGQNAVWIMNGTALSSIVDLPALSNMSYEICGPR